MHLKGKKELSIDDILELYDNTILLMKEDYCELTIASRKSTLKIFLNLIKKEESLIFRIKIILI